jgi:hypothetical protein
LHRTSTNAPSTTSFTTSQSFNMFWLSK